MPSLPLTIRFGTDGDFKMWPCEGWSHDFNDREHTWIDGHVAKLHLMLEFAKNDRMLELDLIPFRPQGMAQDLMIYLNGGFVTYWSVKEADKKSVRVEASLFNVGENIFAFVAPKAVCPRDLGIGDDDRILGLAFRSLHLTDI